MKQIIIGISTILGLLVLVALGVIVWILTIYNNVPDLIIAEDASSLEAAGIIDTYLGQMTEKKKFNGFVMISENGSPLLVKSYGYTDHTLTTKLTPDSALRLASVSKQFTAAGILVLQEQGLIDIDDVITDYIADFPYDDVTTRHLLNQTSGIPDAYMRLAQAQEASIEVLTLDKVMELLKEAQLPASGRPNDAYAYSNTDYVLLAHLAEQISGQSFEDFMEAEVFEPMGLQNTRVWNLVSETDSFPNQAADMDLFIEATPIEMSFLDGVAGDGAVFSSANDFLIWDSFWYGNTLVSADNLQDAFRKPILNDGTESDYGFGWLIRDYGSFHNGEWLAARSFYLRNTRRKTTFVLVDNSNNLNFDKISLQMGLHYAR